MTCSPSPSATPSSIRHGNTPRSPNPLNSTLFGPGNPSRRQGLETCGFDRRVPRTENLLNTRGADRRELVKAVPAHRLAAEFFRPPPQFGNDRLFVHHHRIITV